MTRRASMLWQTPASRGRCCQSKDKNIEGGGGQPGRWLERQAVPARQEAKEDAVVAGGHSSARPSPARSNAPTPNRPSGEEAEMGASERLGKTDLLHPRCGNMRTALTEVKRWNFLACVRDRWFGSLRARESRPNLYIYLYSIEVWSSILCNVKFRKFSPS
jgi:hypothetical protein